MPEARAGLDHAAVLYDGDDEYADAVLPFLLEGLAADEPAFVAVPGDRIALLREGLGGLPVRVVDMTGIGANPARIIPEIRRFADRHAGRPVRFVGEPIWPSRAGAELREATRHEALINVALADVPAAILCPYDASRLDAAVLADAACTHPVVVHGGRAHESAGYIDPADGLPASCAAPLSEPPADAAALALAAPADLARARRRVTEVALAAGLDDARAADVRLAVDEVATNTLRHGGGAGTLRMWTEDGRLLCQVDDRGLIEDPLAGRRVPHPHDPGGRGLLLANRVCDLVEIRTGPSGTSVRLHARLP